MSTPRCREVRFVRTRGSLLLSCRRGDAGQALAEYVGVVVVLALVATLLVAVARRATQDGPAEIGFRLATCELATGRPCSAGDAIAAGVDLSGFSLRDARVAGLIVEGATFDELTAGLGLDVGGLDLLELPLGYGVSLFGVSPQALIDAGLVPGGATVRDLATLGVDLGGADPAALAGWGADVGVLDSVTEAAGLGLDLSPYTVAQLRDLGIELDPDSDVLADVVGWTATDRFTEADLIAAGVDLSQVGARDVLAAAEAVFPGVGATDLQVAGVDVAGLVAPEILAIARSLFPGQPVVAVPTPTGTQYVVIGDGATVTGGDGDDRVVQLAGSAVIDPRGGNNEVTLLGGSTATVVDSNGNVVVRTQGVNTGGVVGAAGGGVDLSVIDSGDSGPGEFVVSLGSDGTFQAALDGPGERTFIVEPGATVGIGGGIVSTDPGGREDVLVAGTLTGGSVDLGYGDDRFQATPTSRLLGVSVDVGDDDDTVDLGGFLQGVRIELGEENDLLIVQDTATGQVSVADSKRSWVRSGSRDVRHNDTLAVGPGFQAIDPGNVSAGLVRVDESGAVVMSVAIDGDPKNIEQIVVLNPDGSVSEQLQSIEPDVRRRGGFLRFLGFALSIAGIVTGLFPLTAAGVAVNSAYAVMNGADLFDVLVGAGTSLLGSGLNIGWLGPLGQAVVGAENGDLLSALLQGASAIGTAGGIPALTTLGNAGLGVRDVVNAIDAGDALGALSSGIGVAGTVTGTTAQPALAQARAAVDLVNTVVGVANGSEANALDALGAIALSGVTLADTFGAFIPPPPPPPDPDDDTGPQAELPVPPLGPPLLYASLAVGGDPVPLEAGQTRVFDGEEGTRWRITNLREATDDQGRTSSAVLRYQLLDAAGNPVPIGGIDRSPVVEDDSDSGRVREVARVEASPDGTSYEVEYSWTDPDDLNSGTSAFADFFRMNPEFDPFSVEAWTPSATTGVQTGLGVGASSLVNSSILRGQNPSLSFTDALRLQAPGQPLNVVRDLATLGITSQQIMEDPIANVLVGGSIGTAVGVGSQELSRRVLNPAANDMLTRYQLGRFDRFLDTGDSRYLRGIDFTTDPNIRFDAPLGDPRDNFFQRNATITGINFAVPAANLAVDAGLEAAGMSDNYLADLLGDSAAVCLGVSVPISIGARRPVWPACYFPAGQSAVARVVTDPPPGVDLGPLGDAIVDSCSNENAILNAAQQFVCTSGRNPDDRQPPVGPAGAPVVIGDWNFEGWDPGMAFEAPSVDGSELVERMRVWQQDLLAEGIRADSAAAVFNNRQEELERLGLSAREATEAVGGTYSNAVGQRIEGPAIVGPAIVGPAIVGPGIVGPCTRGMECWGNGPAGIQYVGPGEPLTPTSPGLTTQTPVLMVPEPGMRGEPRPVTPPPAPVSDSGNWLWNTVTGAWDWWEQANADAARRFNDTPNQVRVAERNVFLLPTTYEVEFPDGRRGVYEAGSGDRISGQGPANVPPIVLYSSPQSGLQIGPYVMPAGGGVGAPVPAF